MQRKTYFPRPIIHGCLLLALALTAPTASAVMVDMFVTPLVGSYRYDLSVNNDSLEDLAIVTIPDAPLADLLIDPTLTTPAGFLASYDGGGIGFGFVDFLEDTTNFAAGTTVSGFSFESLAGPAAYFKTFSALSLFGTEFTGLINVRIKDGPVNSVPDTGGTWTLAGLAFMALTRARRYFPTYNNSQP